jgi:large conductance mechanosensitive channel
MKGFIEFIREQGAVGLAVGFILGGSISKLVASLVNDIINPVLGIFMGAMGSLDKMSTKIGSVEIMWGSFISTFIDFVIIALVVYIGVKLLKLDSLDKKRKNKIEII